MEPIEPVGWIYQYRNGNFSRKVFYEKPEEVDINKHVKAGGKIFALFAAQPQAAPSVLSDAAEFTAHEAQGTKP